MSSQENHSSVRQGCHPRLVGQSPCSAWNPANPGRLHGPTAAMVVVVVVVTAMGGWACPPEGPRE